MTDGRFSGATHGIMVGHVTPEAADGGPIALVRDGDRISIDTSPASDGSSVNGESLQLHVEQAELERRLVEWRVEYAAAQEAAEAAERTSKRTLNVLKKYARNVSSAHYGATTHVVHEDEPEVGELHGVPCQRQHPNGKHIYDPRSKI